MEKAKLIKFLDDKDRSDLAVKLEDYDDDATEQWLQENASALQAVPGFVEFMQPKGSNAPHGLTDEQAISYFSNEDLDLDEKAYNEYKANEAKLNAEMSEKAKLAEEYKRSKDDSYFNTFAANDYAKKKYRQGKTNEAILEDIAAKTAFASDFMPFPVSLYGPVVRTAQTAMNDMSLSKVPLIALDFGTSLLGPAKGAAKSAITGVKTIAGGTLSKLFETKLAKSLEKSAAAIDARELALEAANTRKAIMNLIDEAKNKFAERTLSNKEALDFAKSIEKEYPDLAKNMREHVNAEAANRIAAADAKIAKAHNATNASAKEAKEVITKRALKGKRQDAAIALDDAATDATKKVYRSEVLFDNAGNLTQAVADIDKAYDLYKAFNASTIPAKVLMGASKPAVKASSRVYSRKIDDNTESEYKKAIDKTIEMYKRQWKAGFKPNAGFELEAYNVAKERGDI